MEPSRSVSIQVSLLCTAASSRMLTCCSKLQSAQHNACSRSPWVGGVTAAELVMLAEYTLSTAQLKTGYSTVSLLELGDF